MTISLIQYKEFGASSAPSIQDFFLPAPYEGMDSLIRYLTNGRVCLPSLGYGQDAITGEMIPHRKELLTDGTYTWSSALPYYVEKYNMKLPDDFVRHVRNANRRK